jgi:hypothetical protein
MRRAQDGHHQQMARAGRLRLRRWQRPPTVNNTGPRRFPRPAGPSKLEVDPLWRPYAYLFNWGAQFYSRAARPSAYARLNCLFFRPRAAGADGISTHVLNAFVCTRRSLLRQPNGNIMSGIYGVGIAVVLLYLFVSLRVLRQYERGVVFLLGKFAGVRGPGLTLIFVPIQQMVRVSLRTVTMQIPSQKIITKDNVSIDIAAVAYYHISDPEKAVIVIENVSNAINQISQTTVRNVVGRFSLDQLLSDTASINEQIKDVIDRHTEPWGTQVTAVEIKDIVLPDNMQRAMAKEAEAERERRAKIVDA